MQKSNAMWRQKDEINFNNDKKKKKDCKDVSIRHSVIELKSFFFLLLTIYTFALVLIHFQNCTKRNETKRKEMNKSCARCCCRCREYFERNTCVEQRKKKHTGMTVFRSDQWRGVKGKEKTTLATIKVTETTYFSF